MQPQHRLATVQVVRAFAAIGVLLFHGSQITSKLLGADVTAGFFVPGFSGVDIFFVLSGFIILSTARPLRVSAPLFVAYRAVRIYPVYWVVTLLLCAAYAVAPSAGQEYKGDSAVIVGSLLLFPQQQYVVGVAWTLFYEMAFYLLVAATFFRHERLLDAAFGVWAAAIFFAAVAQYKSDVFAVNALLDPIILEFYFGCLVARFYKARPDFVGWPILLVGGVALFLASWALYLGVESARSAMAGHLRVFFFGVPAALTLAGILYYRGGVPQALVAVGDATYSIYLTHGTFLALLLKIAVMLRLPALVGAPLVCAGALLATVACGYLFFWTVERNLIAWCKQALDRRFARSSAVLHAGSWSA